jgi:hypothetical protein
MVASWITLSFFKRNFIIELKNLLLEKLQTEEFLYKILNINTYSTQFPSPPYLFLADQLILRRKLLLKLIQFLRSVSIRLKEKRSMELPFQEIPVAILVSSCVLLYTSLPIFVKIISDVKMNLFESIWAIFLYIQLYWSPFNYSWSNIIWTNPLFMDPS